MHTFRGVNASVPFPSTSADWDGAPSPSKPPVPISNLACIEARFTPDILQLRRATDRLLHRAGTGARPRSALICTRLGLLISPRHNTTSLPPRSGSILATSQHNERARRGNTSTDGHAARSKVSAAAGRPSGPSARGPDGGPTRFSRQARETCLCRDGRFHAQRQRQGHVELPVGHCRHTPAADRP